LGRTGGLNPCATSSRRCRRRDDTQHHHAQRGAGHEKRVRRSARRDPSGRRRPFPEIVSVKEPKPDGRCPPNAVCGAMWCGRAVPRAPLHHPFCAAQRLERCATSRRGALPSRSRLCKSGSQIDALVEEPELTCTRLTKSRSVLVDGFLPRSPRRNLSPHRRRASVEPRPVSQLRVGIPQVGEATS